MMRANQEKMVSLLVSKGIRPAPDAEFEAVQSCRVYYLRWQGKTGRCVACLFTSHHQPMLTFVGRSVPVSIGDLASLDMLEETEEPA